MAHSSSISISYGFEFVFTPPFSGSFRRMESCSLSGSYLSSSGEIISFSENYPAETSFSHSSRLIVGRGFLDLFSSRSSYLSFYNYFPIYEVIPDSFIDVTSGTTYNINSRPTSITGNYGIIGDDGKLVQMSGNTIINETNNTYYNPATGETTPITSWSYDYSDRSYTVTREDGDTTTITYGDENVNITEGDTVYNIYSNHQK